jgi:hypothetical protein
MADLWSLVWGKPEVDPMALARAIEQTFTQAEFDFRTRVLIRDGTNALEGYWGKDRLDEWLTNSPVGSKIRSVQREDLGGVGFPSLKERIMERTEPEIVKEFLREVGAALDRPVSLTIGGAIALILSGYLSRSTENIDVVDEVPAEIRARSELLDQLARRYGLRLTHFQSRYLPAGWEKRVHSAGSFGKLQAFLIDVHDIFLGKLFSKRAKDLDDLRMLKPALNQSVLIQRLETTTSALMKEPCLRQNVEKNWYILYGQSPPGSQHASA